MTFDLKDTTSIILLVLSLAILIIVPMITFFITKKNAITNQNKILEDIKKQHHVHKKRNNQLSNELKENIKESDNLIDLIKVESEKVQVIENYELYRKKKHRETYFIQSYAGLDQEKEHETTDIVSAQIFTKRNTKELSEKEKIKLINSAPETESKSEESFNLELYEETINIKKRLQGDIDKSKSKKTAKEYTPIEEGSGVK